MVFLERSARAWLVLHAVLGAATVALTTHLAVWIRRYQRGDFACHQGARWFATVGLVVYALQFTLGNLLYPVYKVRVRSEYLESSAAVAADARGRAAARPDAEAKATRLPGNLAHIARAFDVKEHWAALGLALTLAACVVAWSWEPKRDGPGGSTLLVGLSLGAALCAWLAGLVGIVVTTFRSVGQLT